MARYAYHRVDANAEELYTYAEARGMTIERGGPLDALAGLLGFTVVVELKTRRGKLRPSQVAFLKRFTGATAVWRTTADVDATYSDVRWMAEVLARVGHPTEALAAKVLEAADAPLHICRQPGFDPRRHRCLGCQG